MDRCVVEEKQVCGMEVIKRYLKGGNFQVWQVIQVCYRCGMMKYTPEGYDRCVYVLIDRCG